MKLEVETFSAGSVEGLIVDGDDQPYIECSEHGVQRATYVCQHIVECLVDNEPKGFWSAEANAMNLRPDAWCSSCEDMMSRTGEWNEELEMIAGVKLLCDCCYDRVKLMNTMSLMTRVSL